MATARLNSDDEAKLGEITQKYGLDRAEATRKSIRMLHYFACVNEKPLVAGDQDISNWF